MSVKKRPGLPLVAAALAMFTLPAWADNRPALRIAAQSNPPTAEVIDGESNVGYRVNYSVHDTLFQYDFAGDMSIKPHLAESYEWTSPTTLRVKLKQGIKFHDGSEMTAGDVAFSFGPERLTGAEAPGKPMLNRYWSTLESVTAEDDYTVVFTTKFEDAIFLQRLTAWTSQIISKNAFLAADDYNAWRLAPVGLGPFKVDRITPNNETVLVAHDDYWGGKPNVQSVTFLTVPEVSARIAGLLAGDYDIVTDVPPDQLGTIEAADGFSIIGGPVNNNRLIWFDNRQEVMKDPRIRQALIKAIDRDAIVEALWDNKTTVPNGMQYTFYGDMYLEDFPAYQYDPDEAKRLLAEADYAGQEIILRSMDNYYTAETASSQTIVAMWQAIGVNAKLEMIPLGRNWHLDTPRQAGNWSNSALLPDPLLSLWSQHGLNGTQFRQDAWWNSDYEALGKQLETATDLQERRELFRKMLNIIEWEDPGFTTLNQNAVFYGVRDGVNWKPYIFLYMDLAPRALSVE